jgi:hypothetical protein
MLETTREKQSRYTDEDIRQALFSRVHDMQRAPELMRLITNEKVRRYRFRDCFCLLSCLCARACSWRFCLACGSCPPSL